jgi:hypothetical protein
MSGIKDPVRRKEADRKYRERNKEFYRELRRYRRQRLKEHVRKFKDKPCADCAESYPYYVMDFDHRPGTEKLFEIADYLATHVVSTYDKLDAEIKNVTLFVPIVTAFAPTGVNKYWYLNGT